MGRKKKNKAVEAKIVELCEHLTPIYENGVNGFDRCNGKHAGHHGGKSYCRTHLKFHVTGKVAWDEYECGEYEEGEAKIDLLITGEQDEKDRWKR